MLSFGNCNLAGSEISGDLAGVRIRKCNMFRADLRGSYFGDTEISPPIFEDVDLSLARIPVKLRDFIDPQKVEGYSKIHWLNLFGRQVAIEAATDVVQSARLTF